MQTPLDPYPLAQTILQRYVAAPGVIPRATVPGPLLQTALRGAGRMPILASVMRRWRTGDSGWTERPSGRLYHRGAEPQRTPLPAVVQGRRVPPEPEAAARTVSATRPHRLAATAIRSGPWSPASAGSTPMGPSKGATVRSMSAGPSGSTADRSSTSGSGPGGLPVRTQPERPVSAGDADIRLDQPLARTPDPKPPVRSSRHPSATQDFWDRTVRGRPGRRSHRQAPEGADPVVSYPIAPQSRLHPVPSAASGPTGTGKPRLERSDTPAPIPGSDRPAAAAGMDVISPAHRQPPGLSTRTQAAAATAKAQPVAVSHSGTPAQETPDGVLKAGTRSTRIPPEVDHPPTLPAKDRNVATDVPAGSPTGRISPTKVVVQAKPSKTRGSPGKAEGPAAIPAYTNGGASNSGRRPSGRRQPAAVPPDPPRASHNDIGRKIERHLGSLVHTAGPDIHPVAKHIFSSPQRMTRIPSLTHPSALQPAGRTAAPRAPAPIRSSSVVQPSRIANLNPKSFNPDFGLTAAPEGMAVLKPAAPVASNSLKQQPEPSSLVRWPPIGTPMQSSRPSSRADQQQQTLETSLRRAHPLQRHPQAYPLGFTSRAPLQRQPQAVRTRETAARPASTLSDAKRFASHPVAAVQRVHRIHSNINLQPQPAVRTDRLRGAAEDPPPNAQAVFRATADRPSSASAEAARNPDPTFPGAMNSQPHETGTGGDSVDLERLADEIYAILERRLTIERERLGQ